MVHAAARILANEASKTSAQVRRRFAGLLAAMQRHRGRVGALGTAFDHFRKVARSYWPGLFHAARLPDLPRTNNALEQLFGSQRYHERRATGRKTASAVQCCVDQCGSWPASPHACRPLPVETSVRLTMASGRI